MTSNGNLSNWNSDYPLSLANEPLGNRAWLGSYVLAAVYDRALTPSEVERNFLAPPEVQLPPDVSAGDDQVVEYPQAATLAGTIVDDGLPDPPAATTALWEQISGPGTATFTTPNTASTDVSVTEAGKYEFRLTGSDGELTTTDTVLVSFVANEAPTADAGPDLAAEVSSPITLAGVASDDGLPSPPGAVTTQWSQVSGPSTATFGTPTQATTSAVFGVSGTYVLRLTVDDGVLTTTDDVTVIAAANTAPTVDAGPTEEIIQIYQVLNLDGTMTDDGLPNPPAATSTTWSLVGGSGTAAIDEPSEVDTTVTFTDPGTYVLRLTADDGSLQTSDDITVHVTGIRRIDDGLVSLWGFEEGSGTVVHDISGVGTPMDLTIQAPSETAWIDGALVFVGSAAAVTDGAATKLTDAVRASGGLTFEAWISQTQLRTHLAWTPDQCVGGTMVEKCHAGPGFLHVPADQRHPAHSGFSPSGTPVAVVPSSGLTHVVFAVSEIDGKARLYVDGVHQATVNRWAGLEQWNESFPLAIGNEPTLDQFRVSR